MTLNDYIESLQKLVETEPKAGEYEVITAIDDEGNGYNTICIAPAVGSFQHGEEWIPRDHYQESPEEYEDYTENAVVVN